MITSEDLIYALDIRLKDVLKLDLTEDKKRIEIKNTIGEFINLMEQVLWLLLIFFMW